MLTTILAGVVVLGVLILVHELGHFMAAKAVDIEVIRFSIGLGPKAVGFTRGETEYVISWLPLGGYVKMAGFEDEELAGLEGESRRREDGRETDGNANAVGPSDGREGAEERRGSEGRDFEDKPLWARTLVLSAGVGMNFLFAVLAFAIIAGGWGLPEPRPPVIGEVVEENLPVGTLALAELPGPLRVEAVDGRRVEDFEQLRRAVLTAAGGPIAFRFSDGREVTVEPPSGDSARQALAASLEPVLEIPPVISDVLPGEAAEAGDLRQGDRVLRAGGRPVESWQEFRRIVERNGGDTLEVVVERDGTETSLTLVPGVRTVATGGDTLRYGRIGAAVDGTLAGRALASERRRVGPARAVAHGVTETWDLSVLIVEFVGRLVTGGVGGDALAGPVRIVQISGEAARLGPVAFLSFMALLSVNLAILNLLPIPILDGGRLVFLLYEAVRGRPVSTEVQIRWTQVGLLLVAALMVWAIGNDLVHVFGG